MVMNTSTENLCDEVQAARELTTQRLAGVDDAILRYQGGDRSGHGKNREAPENVEFKFVSYLIPSLAFDCPRVSVTSALVRKQDEALALEVGLNRWARDTRLREPLLEAAFDFAFAWACIVTSNKPAPELMEDETKGGRRGIPNRPYSKRIPFNQAFRDPLSTSPYSMRFAGHDTVADKEDLLREADDDPDAGWNADVIRKMATDADLEKVGRRRTNGQPSRNEVVYTQVWVADAEIDWDEHPGWSAKEKKLCHGMLFYLAETLDSGSTVKGAQIRKPQPFYGPRWGPYVFIGEYIVPNDPMFMSPMAPMQPAIRFYNEVNDVLIVAIKNYKRLMLVNDAGGDLVDTIRGGSHDHVFDSTGYERGQAEAFEIGGATNQMIAHKDMLKQLVESGLGMGDIQSGAVTGEASATENALAAEASNARMSMALKQWDDGVSMVERTAAYYLWNDPSVWFPISMEEAMLTGRKPEEFLMEGEDGEPEFDQPLFEGGTDDTNSFDSLDLEIQPWSQRRMSAGQAAANLVQLQNVISIFGPMVPQMPWVKWDKVDKAVVKWTGNHELRGLFDLGVAADVAESEALMRQAEMQAQDTPKAGGGGGGKGPQAMPPTQSPTQPASQPPQSQAPKAKPKPLPGRTSGGSSGAKASQSVGAA